MENHTTHGAKGKLNNLAYEQLKEMIITGEVSHDKPIVERAISQKLNMSRTPIKHALSRLQQEGLIRIVPRHGVFPVVITYPEYQHILEIREVLEGLAARLAVDHFSNADLRELRFIFENLGDIRDIKKVGHQKFALANVETVGSLYDHLSLVRLKTIELTGRRNRSVDEHEAILKALEQRDADRSETAMRSHIRTIKKDIEAAVKKNPGVFPNNTVLSDSLGSIADT
jgi:DNA-binding GntR family transcriptional regulator